MVTIINRKQLVPVGDTIKPPTGPLQKIVLDLPDFFDDSLAEEVLSLSLDDLIQPNNLLLKSMYDFDVESEEGVSKLLELIPIIDPDILKTLMQEIWPGYPVDSLTFDTNLARAEIRGYLLDYLEGHGSKAEDIDHTDE